MMGPLPKIPNIFRRARDPLSELYHSPAATAEAQATVELLWESTQGVTYTFTFVGSLFLMAGFIALGAIGGLGAILSLLVFEAMGIMFISDLVFLLLVGRRLHSLSKEPDPPIA